MRAIDADHLRRWILSRVFKTQLSVADAIDQIDREDTIEPERKKGKWIMLDKGLIVTSYKCSECGRTIVDVTGYDVSEDYPFCHCGADMMEETK